MKKYLFLFTIGPVQSFIAQARKTHDLWAGSKILSDLIEYAIYALEEKVKTCKIIFPHKEIKSKPNRFIAIIESDDPKGIGMDIENMVKDQLKKLSFDIVKKYANFDISEIFLEQIENFLEIYWVILPYEESSYAELYEKIESYLGSIKNIRKFRQNSLDCVESYRKCSVCGQREALFYRKSDKKPRNISFQAQEINEFRLNQGESLCGICFIKRFYKTKSSSFSSTAKIASLSWVEKLTQVEIKEYKDFFKNFDEELFFDENLRKEHLIKYDHYKDDENLEKAKKYLNNLYKKYGVPSKYYAIVMLDGDSMGKWLSGEFLSDKSHLRDFHLELSKKLGEYTDKTKEIIEGKGKLVYAGGDDVLSFVNIDHLLFVMKNLRDFFPKFEEIKNVKNRNKSSASMGVAIAHYKTPLSEVIKWARKMEKEAKEDKKDKKDAFAIAVLKRSGEIHKIKYKWYLNGKSTVDIIKSIVKSIINKKFSNTFTKVLADELRRFKYDVNEKFIKSECKRLLKRASNPNGVSLKSNEIGELSDKLLYLFVESYSLQNFISTLNIINFLSKEVGELNDN
ncbi:type III-B CRISPR-associated protein Cas10/Cmr2 [Thermosipho sp. 1223]|uniref:type III-B CRISPR-associated protein Cas10/Cmr2 n=1 Tax=Thermosipho sp. 1223 TaxID=1643332 RepID=UPI0009861847|nr:type III-B CRISPR-associated protein Cas10/Cmr2 [Thermosipho sp. 1223]OOC46913.1 hypothetical protein XO09_04330 [Thermosipho sp. 1223]